MANKAQAKAAVDAAVVLLKADIDALPNGVNILEGDVQFAPNRWRIRLDAGGNAATASSWLSTWVATLTAAGRNPVVTVYGRRLGESENSYTIKTALASYQIVNF